MQGYLLVFVTEQALRHGSTSLVDWLLEEVKRLGVTGATVNLAAEGYGRRGHFHAARFFELADQPVEVSMAVDAVMAERLFARLREEKTDLFYLKIPIEFGRIVSGD